MKRIFSHSQALRDPGCRLLSSSNGGNQGTYRDTGYANKGTYALATPGG